MVNLIKDKTQNMVLWAFILILVISSVSALEMCSDSIDINSPCVMITPTLEDCAIYNYSISLTNGTIITEGNLTLLNEQIYKFNFTEPTGDYIVRLCDGSTREVKVEDQEEELKMIAIVLGIICIIVFLIWLGSITETSGWRFVCWGLALVEVIVLAGTVYGVAAGLNLSTLMNVNFLALLVICFGVGMIVIYQHSIKIMNPFDKGDEQRKEWRRK